MEGARDIRALFCIKKKERQISQHLDPLDLKVKTSHERCFSSWLSCLGFPKAASSVVLCLLKELRQQFAGWPPGRMQLSVTFLHKHEYFFHCFLSFLTKDFGTSNFNWLYEQIYSAVINTVPSQLFILILTHLVWSQIIWKLDKIDPSK